MKYCGKTIHVLVLISSRLSLAEALYCGLVMEGTISLLVGLEVSVLKLLEPERHIHYELTRVK